MDARAREAMLKPRRETKMVDKVPQGQVYAPAGARQPNKFEIGFTVRLEHRPFSWER